MPWKVQRRLEVGHAPPYAKLSAYDRLVQGLPTLGLEEVLDLPIAPVKVSERIAKSTFSDS